MNNKIDSMSAHIRSAVPEKFVDYMMKRHQWFHAEANASAYRDPRWSGAEGSYIAGHLERILGESEMRKAAILSRLDCEDAEHNGRNCTCVKVHAGNLVITSHRVPSPGFMVREAESRKQAAVANRFLNGYVLEGALCAPLPTLESAESIQVYLLHGTYIDPRTDEKKFFMQFAVPDSLVEDYCWVSSLAQLKQEYIADARAAKQTPSTIKDNVRPKLKKPAKKKEEKE
jgi:hypothetical protein